MTETAFVERLPTWTTTRGPRVRTSQCRVRVLIPAHNEADTIALTLSSLRAQTIPVASVMVVADNCTDATAVVAERYGAQVVHTEGNTHMKAGALNQGLGHLLESVGDQDFILVMDADSRLVPGFLQTAITELDRDSKVGAVCATFAGEAGRSSLVHVLQRTEYARFARSIARRGARAQVLSGVATVFPVGTLKRIGEARLNGRLPQAPGIYDVTAATEDIELTYAVRRLGYKPIAPKGCLALPTPWTLGRPWPASA